MKRIAIFASGSGTNAENIALYFKDNTHIRVGLILSNRKEAKVLQRAQMLGIPTFVFAKKDFFETEKVFDKLTSEGIEFIILSGFLLKVPQKLISSYPKRIVNIHPSLLPKYGGKGMYGMNVHQSVVDNKESKSGITIHFVNEHFDQGETVFQAETQVDENDTAEDLSRKVHLLEYKYFPKIIEKIILDL